MNSRLHNHTKEWINQRSAEFEYPGTAYVKVSVSAWVKQTLISGTFQSQVPALMKPNQLFHTNNYHWGANLSEVISTNTYRGRKEWEQWIRKTGSLLQEWASAAEKQMCRPKYKETRRSSTTFFSDMFMCHWLKQGTKAWAQATVIRTK